MLRPFLFFLVSTFLAFVLFSGDTPLVETFFRTRVDLIHESVLITGASSGIGKGLALAYAKPGVHLTITGQNEKRLEETASSLKALGASVTARVLDVTNSEGMKDFIQEIDQKHPLTLVIANAGIGDGGRKDIDTAYDVMNVNVMGVMNTLRPIVDAMKERKKGQIAVVSSVAAFFEMPGDGAYIGSKTAVRIFGQTLRALLAPHNVYVSVICPGWVHSRIQPDPGPLVLEADVSAEYIKTGLEKNLEVIYFPYYLYFGSKILGLLPTVKTTIWCAVFYVAVFVVYLKTRPAQFAYNLPVSSGTQSFFAPFCACCTRWTGKSKVEK